MGDIIRQRASAYKIHCTKIELFALWFVWIRIDNKESGYTAATVSINAYTNSMSSHYESKHRQGTHGNYHTL